MSMSLAVEACFLSLLGVLCCGWLCSWRNMVVWGLREEVLRMWVISCVSLTLYFCLDNLVWMLSELLSLGECVGGVSVYFTVLVFLSRGVG